MSFLQKNIIFLGVFIFGLGFGFFLGDNSQNTYRSPSLGSGDVFSTKKIEEVKDIIQKEYYHFSEKDQKEIEDGMIQSIVNSLGDKHSSYFTPKEAKDFSEVLRGDFEGIGAVIDEHPRGIILRKIFSQSPAQKSGLTEGDILTHIGSESLIGLSTEEAVKKIRGPKGSTIEVSYLHGENLEEKKLKVTRDTILIPSTYEKMLTGSVAYIEVLFFGDHTKDEFQKSLEHVIHSGATSIILDFRNNGGGYLESAVDLLSFFLPDGSLAVRTRETHLTKPEEYKTKRSNQTNTDIPLIVLVNSLSASSTEIFAGAMQDYGRALIVGEKTYGKGSVQLPFPLEDGSIIKITIGRWFTPKDHSIDKNGITPDVGVPLFERDIIKKYDRQLDAAYKIIQSLEKGSLQKTKEDYQKINFSL